ncbi:MAG: PaaI family thioesterase [Pseudomonadaceae bacterium]|nr:PaaI family thioesterase [Pseudomonadaceae bacterium]
MKILEELRASGDAHNMQAVADALPYARFLGLRVESKGDELTTVLPFRDELIGNVNLPAIHGGVIGSMLELTAVMQLLRDSELSRLPKTVDLAIDYLRSGLAEDLFGRAHVTRQGRRVANVRVELWQHSRSKPIASARGHFLLSPI